MRNKLTNKLTNNLYVRTKLKTDCRQLNSNLVLTDYQC